MTDDIFLFGSSLESASPNDIDIIIVYKLTPLLKYDKLQKLREEISAKIWEEIKKPTDVILLNEFEYMESCYIDLDKKSILNVD